MKTYPNASSTNYQSNLKTPRVWHLPLGLAIAVLLTANMAAAKSGGTDVLHFTSKSAMVNTGVEPQAVGNIRVMLTDQGNAQKQQLRITGTKLNSNTTYRLIAFIGDNTNTTDVVDFNTDKKGSFSLSYLEMNHEKPSKKGSTLPDALEPLCHVRELAIANFGTNVVISTNVVVSTNIVMGTNIVVSTNVVVSTNFMGASAVLTAVLGSPDKGQYLVKSTMKNSGFLPAATGSLSIKASATSTTFKLTSAGLTTNADYGLAFNGVVTQTYTADNSGQLTVISLPTNAPNVLDIQSVALTDGTGTNLVLTTVGLGMPCSLETNVVIVPAL